MLGLFCSGISAAVRRWVSLTFRSCIDKAVDPGMFYHTEIWEKESCFTKLSFSSMWAVLYYKIILIKEQLESLGCSEQYPHHGTMATSCFSNPVTSVTVEMVGGCFVHEHNPIISRAESRMMLTEAGFPWLLYSHWSGRDSFGWLWIQKRAVTVGEFGASVLNFSSQNGLWGNAGSGMVTRIRRSCKTLQSFSLLHLVTWNDWEMTDKLLTEKNFWA